MEIIITFAKLQETITDLEMMDSIKLIFEAEAFDEENAEIRLISLTCPKELLDVLGFEIDELNDEASEATIDEDEANDAEFN